MNNTTTINSFNKENSNITKMKAQYHRIMTTITNGILKFEPTIKIPIGADNTFFTVNTFSRINFFP